MKNQEYTISEYTKREYAQNVDLATNILKTKMTGLTFKEISDTCSAIERIAKENAKLL